MVFKEYLMKDALEAIIDYRGKTPKKSDAGIPTLSAKSVKNNYINYSECYYISPAEYERFMVRGFPKKGDILLTTEAPMGMVAKLDRDDVAIAQRLLTLRGKPEVLNNDFLLYLLQSPYGQGLLKAKETGTTVTGIKQAEFRKIIVRLPDIKTQKKISSILNSLNHKIECNNKINDNLQQQASVITKQWLFDNTLGYEMLPLTQIAEINPDTYSPKENWEYVNYLDTSSIIDGSIFGVQYIDPKVEKLPSRARRKIVANDVVFSTVRPNQRHFGIISSPKPNMLVSTGFAVIRSKHPRVCSELIYLCLTENEFIEKMQQLAEQSTSTFPSIKPSDLGACAIPCPNDDSSTSLTELLKSAFALIATNQNEISLLAHLRDTLLPKLMSGEIDVSDIQI